MEEVLRRHSAEFDEAYHLIHTVDLLKGDNIYRVEIHQQMTSGYRKHFIARHFKRSEAMIDDNPCVYWNALDSVSPMADTARDALNQALIWLSVQTKKGVI